MKVKLSDATQSQVEVQSVSQVFSAFNDSTTVNINIKRTNKDMDYYRGIFTDDSVKTITVLNDEGASVSTINCVSIDQISINMQDDSNFVTINISC